MRGIDTPTGRMIALIVLLTLAAASLRGYVPAAVLGSHQQTTESPAALAVVAVLLAVSLGIVAVAIIHRMRNRPAVVSSIGALPRSMVGSSGDKTRPSWRVVLIGLGVLSAWLLLAWLLTRLIGPHGVDQLAPGSGSHTNVPATDIGSPPTSGAPRPERPQRNPGRNVMGYLAAAGVGMLLLTIASAVSTVRSRRGRARPPSVVDDERLRSAAPAAGPESLARAAELGLAEIGDPSREPREAIIGCYVTMERELAHVPDAVPQDFDTPTEVLARAVEHHALPADNAIQLVNLFAEARFSPHLMTEGHREDAVRILRLVLAELRSSA
jgi:hypothetical protein